LSMINRRDMSSAYFEALNLPQNSTDSEAKESQKLALDRAHDLRKFEIENYWKRATYFWSFQAIAFVVLGLILKDGQLKGSLQILQLPASIGAVSGFVGWLSARGSKFWQENWEAHVDMLEQEIEGSLTQLVWSDNRISYSVSRLNQAFMGITASSWVIVMAVASSSKTTDYFATISPWWLFGLLILSLIGILFWTRQNMAGLSVGQDSWIDSKHSWQWLWKRRGNGPKQRQLLLRHTKAKDARLPEK
jgi:hypothetical protein